MSNKSLHKSPLAISVALVFSGSAPATTIVVDETRCSLVDAITAANADTTTGGCPAGNDADTLQLTCSTHTLTSINNSDNVWGSVGLPVVNSVITISGNCDPDGPGAVIERSTTTGTPDFSLIRVDDHGRLTLQDVTLRNGRGPLDNRYAAAAGLNVLYDGHAVLVRTTISDNRNGPAIRTLNGRLIIEESTIKENDGGIICEPFNVQGCDLKSSKIMNNGGGLWIGGWGGASLVDSTIKGNAGGLGGLGLSLENVTVSNNVGTGVSMSGGGIRNSTISGNSGDGIASDSFYGGPVIEASTVTANRGAGLRVAASQIEGPILTNSVIAGNLAGDCIGWHDGTIPVISAGNLVGDGSCRAVEQGALVGNPRLGPLLDNGGETFTHALLRGSPAVNTASSWTCAVKDQRGTTRPQGVACDIGAYEVGMSVAPIMRPIVAFFDQAVREKTLVGTFAVPNRWHRLQAVRRQLLLAGDYILQSAIPKACSQIKRTLGRITLEGTQPETNDYATGPSAPELTTRLRNLRSGLGCSS